VRALGLRFGAELCAGHTPFKIRDELYPPSDAIRMFYEYYDGHPELVAVNVATAAA
jgi:hypothetical protein